MFFEQPAGDLPVSATRWDGTTDWIQPNVSHPSLGELHFMTDKSQDQQSGTISFFLHNFIGQYQIKVDVDNDGNFDGQNDVTLNEQMKKLSNGLQQVHFDGVDKTGQIIPTSQKIGIEIVITKVAEIHLVASDVEGRTGGVELIRMNGDNAPTTRLCWNDTQLEPISLTDPTYTTPVTDGRSCPDSTGGVHGWGYNDSSWGNARYIDDWIYASAKLDGSSQIVYPEDAIANTAMAKKNWLLLALVVALFISAGATGVVIVIRRRKNSRQLQPSPTRELPQQPSAQPPENQQNPYDDKPPTDQLGL